MMIELKENTARLHSMMALIAPALHKASATILFPSDGLREACVLAKTSRAIMTEKHTESIAKLMARQQQHQHQQADAAQLNTLNNHKSDLEHEVGVLEGQMHSLQDSIEVAEMKQAQLIEVDYEIEQRNGVLIDINKKIELAGNEIRVKIDKATADVQQWERKVRQTQEEVAINAQTATELQHRANSAEKIIAEAMAARQSEMEQLNKDVASRKAELARHIKLVEENEDFAQIRQNALSATTQKLEAKKSALEIKTTEIEQEFNTKSHECVMLTEKIASLRNEFEVGSMNREKMVALDKEVASLRDQLCGMQLMSQDGETENAALRSDNMVATQRLHELEGSMQNMAQRMAELDGQVRQVGFEIGQHILQGRAEGGDVVLLKRSSNQGARHWSIVNNPSNLTLDGTNALPEVLRTDEHNFVLARVVFRDGAEVIVESIGPMRC